MDFSIIKEINKLKGSFSKPFNKQEISNKVATTFGLVKDRKVYSTDKIALRFSSAKKGYSNTFLGLQKIIDNDFRPLIVCIVREDSLEFLLANTTFINCISHSSKNLTVDNIRGSANLSNIIKELSGIKNSSDNFDKLFKTHLEIPQSDNIERIVEATNDIKGNGKKFLPNGSQQNLIFDSPLFIKNIEKNSEFIELRDELYEKVVALKDKILLTSTIDNVNLRGNAIEQLITNDENSHDLGDISEVINDDCTIILDVKSKMLTKSSAPKAYNVDKFLDALSNGNTYFGYLFVGVDDVKKAVYVRLVSALDKALINNTVIQKHWSGINSRGTAQLNDKIKTVFEESFANDIDVDLAKDYLKYLINL